MAALDGKRSVATKDPAVKDDGHLQFVRSLPCCLCGDNVTVEVAHIRMGYHGWKRPMGMGERDDRWVIPLCGRHHRDQHNMREAIFWRTQKRNPARLARMLWMMTGDHAAASRAIRSHAW